MSIDFETWLAYGIEHGFCSQMVRSMHDGTPMSDEEQDKFDEGWDTCIWVVRLYEQTPE